MKILFDHQTFSLQKYGGISRYFANMHYGINKSVGNSSYISALYTQNAYLENDQLILGNTAGRQFFSDNKDKIYKWNRRYSRWNVRWGNYDVFHPTYLDLYFIKYIRKPFVVTIHDMIYELMPDIFDNADEIIKRKKILIEKAAALIAISDYTKNDILKFYPQAEKKITVVHHGAVLTIAATASQLELPDNYILYVGERWLYKNFARFIEAIAPLLQADRGLKVLCAGGGSFLPEELNLFQQKNITSQCLQINATEDELKQLYANAALFVFPSLIEGFGLPILEAFAQNCPVVCSGTSCLPEVAGNAAVYFDPLSAAGINEAVSKVLFSAHLQSSLRLKGSMRLANFGFDICVQKTLGVYELL